MSKIDGNVSLTKLSAELDVSPAWIKKIEKYIGLDWGSGRRGRKSFYSPYQVYFFRKILVLKALGFNLQEIKTLYDKEVEIGEFARCHFSLAFIVKREIEGLSDEEKREAAEFEEVQRRSETGAIGHILLYLNGDLSNELLEYNAVKYQRYKSEERTEAKRFERLLAERQELANKFLTWIHKNLKAITSAVEIFETVARGDGVKVEIVVKKWDE
ncbi:MAG: hypothetical protein WCG78_00200 [Candidatus Omnitrophota bacterium]